MDIVALVLEGQGSWVTGRKKTTTFIAGEIFGISPDASDVPDEQGEIMVFFSQNTLLETNIAPENGCLEY